MNKLLLSILASAGFSLAMVPMAQAAGYCGGNIPQYQSYCQNIVNPNACTANAAYCTWVQPGAPVNPGYPSYPPPPAPGYPQYPGVPQFPWSPYGPRPGWPGRGWGHRGPGGWGRGGDRGRGGDPGRGGGWGRGGWGRGGNRGRGGDPGRGGGQGRGGDPGRGGAPGRGGDRGGQVCFFIDVNYGGGQMCLAPGQSLQNLANNGWNDKISAIEVQGRASATVCSDAYFQGSCATVSSSMPALWNLNGRNFNDVISSIRVQ